MNRLLRLVSLLAIVSVAPACEVFENPNPERVHLRMQGSDGRTVMAIYSKQFVAAVNELGVTRVEVFGSDTVQHVLPIDTIVDIAFEQRFFVQVETMPDDTVDVNVVVEIDGRRVVNESGGIFPGTPWQYVYQFNQFFTELIEVIL